LQWKLLSVIFFIIFILFLKLQKYFLQWNESQKEGKCDFPRKANLSSDRPKP
jgi:hypothetical protein